MRLPSRGTAKIWSRHTYTQVGGVKASDSPQPRVATAGVRFLILIHPFLTDCSPVTPQLSDLMMRGT